MGVCAEPPREVGSTMRRENIRHKLKVAFYVLLSFVALC